MTDGKPIDRSDTPPEWTLRPTRALTPDQERWCLDRALNHGDVDAGVALLNAFVIDPGNYALATYVARRVAQWMPKAEASQARAAFGLDGKPENTAALRRALILASARDHGVAAASAAMNLTERGVYNVIERATADDHALADLLHPPRRDKP